MCFSGFDGASLYEGGIIMLTSTQLRLNLKQGFTLIEVLIAVVILAFGLLGLAALQSKMQLAEFESYQRAQALLLLSEMTERINANSSQAASYVSVGTIGTGDSQPTTCVGGPGAAFDLCEWSNDLKGAGETSSGTNVGAMVGARGCITQVQASNTSAGVCTPGIYQVDVVWQGMQPTTASAITCGQGSYGSSDALRRVVSAQVTVGLPTCS
jgi:type IV pilus assembly protein PilV